MTGDEQRAAAIRNLQRYLTELGHYDKRIPPVPVDGIYGGATREAVRSFQRSNGFEPTGDIDLGLWNELYRQYLLVLEFSNPPVRISPFPTYPHDYRIRRGERGELVGILQHMLITIGIGADGFDTLVINGVYDEPTERAVRDFQIIVGLEPTGEVERRTWNRLADAYNKYSAENQ